jgi:DNA primase
VINPYALELRIPDLVFKKLRTNMHYLRLIEIITLYHQYQREVKTDASGQRYIETNLTDIACANWLVKESLLRKSDELSGELREFFERIKKQREKRTDLLCQADQRSL